MGAAGLPRLNMQDLSAHRVTVPGVSDEIFSPLYDFATYAAAGQTQLNFFSTPIGQGTTSAPGASGPKTEADTNMQNAGLLPKGNRFYLTGLEVLFFPGSPIGAGGVADATAAQFVQDMYAIGKSGWMRLRIQNRDYVLDGPLCVFPPIERLDGFAAMCTNLTTGAATFSQVDYASWAGVPYQIVPTFIESNQFFGVQMNWPIAVATPSTIAARIGVRLRGRLIRDAQ